MKVIVTGGKGSLAQYLIKFIQDKFQGKIEIITTLKYKDDLNSKFIYDKDKVTFHFCDIYDTAGLIWQYKPDYFFNLAAISNSVSRDKENLFKINTEAVKHQLDAIKTYSKHTKYLNVGSSEEINGFGYYAESKRQAHKIVEEYRVKYNLFALQPFVYNFTSELQKDHFLLPKIIKETYRVCKEFDNDEKVIPMEIGNTRVSKSFLWAGEVAEKLWSQMTQEDRLFRGFIPDIHIQSLEQVSLKNIIEQSFALFGKWGVWSNEEKNLNHAIDDVFVTYKYKTGVNLKVVKLVVVNPEFCRENEKEIEYVREKSNSMNLILEKLKNSLTK